MKAEKIRKTEAMLENYLEIQRKIAVLRFKMSHPVNVSQDEVISQMAMPGQSNDVGCSGGHISDRTMYIALHYEERTLSMNTEEMTRLSEKLFPLEREAERVEFYVGLLEPRHAKTLRMHYFEGHIWRDVADMELTSLKTILKRRAAAVEHLANLVFDD